MIAIIIQARTGSTRFKCKTLKKIYNEHSILDLIIENLKSLNCKIIIATTDRESDKEIVSTAIKYDLDYYCGDENNVLKRFIECALEFNVSKIIRVCADNVFIQLKFISTLIKNRNSNFDYMSYKIGETNAILTHWGLFGEFVTLKALKTVQQKTINNFYLEHVTNYIYTHPNEFKIKFFDVPQELLRRDVRLTIDTLDDFKICKNIIKYLTQRHLIWNYINILEYLNKFPSVLKDMLINIKRNEKI